MTTSYLDEELVAAALFELYAADCCMVLAIGVRAILMTILHVLLVVEIGKCYSPLVYIFLNCKFLYIEINHYWLNLLV